MNKHGGRLLGATLDPRVAGEIVFMPSTAGRFAPRQMAVTMHGTAAGRMLIPRRRVENDPFMNGA